MKNLYIASCDENGGIYRYAMDGGISPIDRTELKNPMYMTAYDNKMYVLLREAFADGTSGMLSFDIAADGSLKNPSETVSTEGKVACHIYAGASGVYAANYVSGSVIKFGGKCDVHEGHGINPNRQEKAHTHFVCPTPDGKYICVTDLGLDAVFFYDTDLNIVSKAKVPDGCGARHLIFSADGKYMYCANELISSVSVFKYADGKAELLHTYPALPKDYTGENTAAAIRLCGNRLYVSNRGADNVAVFEVSGENLKLLNYIKVGAHPRDIEVSDGILISTDMNDDKVTFYNAETGEKLDYEISGIKSPLCVLIR